LEAGASVAAVRNEEMVDLVVLAATDVDGEAVVETANATARSLVVVAGPPFDLRR
jgi:malonyl CoA-acyl carrier protein transacylase